MKNYVNIDESSIEFKNILSGPAQIGRILNYIILIGEKSLKLKKGSRSDNMDGNIGNAWCIEFMIGLGLVSLGEKLDEENINYLNLTQKGISLYNILLENAIHANFDQNDNKQVMKQLKDNNALNIIHVLEYVFRESIVFKNMCIFLEVDKIESEILTLNANDFREQFYGELKEFYENEKYITNGQGATTASNRVPSLIQLCCFLNYSDISRGNIIFDINALKNGIFNENFNLDISDNHLINEYEKEDEIIEKLKMEFGISGNQIIQKTVRLSQTQLIFKERLKREHKKQCWLCGLENNELLIASHIKPAAECNIYEKTDNNNGLLLCAMHDKLFDLNLISFDCTTGDIMISDNIKDDDKILCNIHENMTLDPRLLNDKRIEYLIWHNTDFYDKNDK